MVDPRIATKHLAQWVRPEGHQEHRVQFRQVQTDRYEGEGVAGQGFLAITLGFLRHLENTFNDNQMKVLKPDISFQCLCLLTCQMGIIAESSLCV